jgi:Fe-S-cluster containining protein
MVYQRRAVRTYWLTCHLGYACRHSGACCSSKWPIPIERDRAASVEREIAAGHVAPMADPWLTPAIGAPDHIAGTLALTARGDCVFFRRPAPGARLDAPGACAIHHAKPASCRHFPYVCLVDARGVRATLSHYCPTAAAMLVDHEGPLDIVEGPAVFEDGSLPEGLDAREVLPPLEAPGRLVDLQRFTEWEQRLVRSLTTEGLPLWNTTAPPPVELFDLARDALPPMLAWPQAPGGLERTWTEAIAPQWPHIAPVAGRYLAARAFGSWVAYQGAGLPAVERSVIIAAAVFSVELARRAGPERASSEGETSRRVGRDVIIDALRHSDLLLVHYVDPEAFARKCE